MKKIILIIFIALLTGCSSANGIARITEVDNGVVFTSSRPVEMIYKKEGAEYSYNSQSPSLFRELLSVLTLGVIGGKK